MPSEVKTLILYAHPEAQESVANRRLLQELATLGQVTIHDLYACYPDFFINIAEEQQLLRTHSIIVFQHPLYTYSCPALLKEWFDRVLTRGFVADNKELAGKYWRSVITTGEPETAYHANGLNRYPMSDIMRPFELTAQTCQMHWLTPMLIYYARRQSSQAMQSYAEAYAAWLQNPLPEELT
jgi:glutathione-regulated potassium-efflux system ancillary protein KefG